MPAIPAFYRAIPFLRLGVITAVLSSVLCAGWSEADAQTRRRGPQNAQAANGPRADYRSKNFLIHTDLPAEEARALLERMETMLSLLTKYWGRPNPRVIECYVVKNLANWPNGTLDPRGLQSIQGGGGVTRSTVITQGNAFIANAIVYAVADRGTPLHEAVHAYCAHAFGTTGPVWYSEGMAELGQYWRANDESVKVHDVVERYLQQSEPKSLNEIINSDETTGDSWQNYAWRWALCHLLATNPNYKPRFRQLGLGMLQKQRGATFEAVYGSMAKEISFEYLFFLEHLENGFRCDLCAWDWKARYRKPRGRGSLLSRIEARGGWQPSRLEVEADKEYEFSTEGTWKLIEDGEELTAAGGSEGAGRLMGVIMQDYELSEPFELGAEGTFKASQDGELLLRCNDAWGKLADNSGRVTVRIKAK